MQNSYLFYDIETTGLNKCFDQVLQFAAIRTDLDLNELDRHEIVVKLNPDVIPSPMAILVHQLGIDKIQDGLKEYEAIGEIHKLLNAPGTISVGYNSLGFDDEFLRFSFYRNLMTPYTHQYAGGCSRMDIYPMAVMYYLFKPDVVVWPKIDDVTSLKLEHLNSNNKLTQGKSHDAMSDVESTLELARLFKKEQKMWDYLCGCFNKQVDLSRLDKLGPDYDDYKQALLVEGALGSVRSYQSVVIGLGMHEHYKNQSLWLQLDSFSFSEITPNNISTKTFVKRKRFGETPILLPLTERFKKYLSDERLKLVADNLAWIRENHEMFLKIVRYHKEYKYPEIPDLDVDAALYQIGFIKSWEQIKCNNFHAAKLNEKIDLVDDFSSLNLRTQAIRVLGRNYPDILVGRDDLYKEFDDYLNKRKSDGLVVNYKNETRLTPKAALAEIDVLRQTKKLDSLQEKLMEDLTRYLQSYFASQ